MEFLLLWWDELDDVVALCRHVLGSVIVELASAGASLRAWGAALTAWWRLPAESGLPSEDLAQ